MRRLYLVLGILIVALGLFHTGSTPSIFDELNSRALWFASGGLAMIFQGALNLLNRAYGHAARGLFWTCGAANLVMLGFMALGGYIDKVSMGQFITVVGLFGVTALVAVLPSATGPNPRDTLSTL